MTTKLFEPASDPQSLRQADLETVLSAWHSATERMTQTYAVLSDEIRRLNVELEAKNRELARKNRLADLGQMASHIAHEVRNNLTPVSLYASLLRRRLSEDSGSLDVLRKIEGGLAALDVVVNDLLGFAAEREPRRVWFSLKELVDEIHDSLSPQLVAQDVHVEVDIPLRLSLLADRDMTRRAIVNLVLNAIDAMPDGGEISFIGCRHAGGIDLEVADTGPGLDEQIAPRIFDPFFTTKSHGTGLGLAVVQRLLEAHGGCVDVQNCPEGGAAFTLKFPLPALEAAA